MFYIFQNEQNICINFNFKVITIFVPLMEIISDFYKSLKCNLKNFHLILYDIVLHFISSKRNTKLECTNKMIIIVFNSEIII